MSERMWLDEQLEKARTERDQALLDVEAMRAKCEAKCRDIAMMARNLSAGQGAARCADAIAALKDDGLGSASGALAS